jgi:hypothetical protein
LIIAAEICTSSEILRGHANRSCLTGFQNLQSLFLIVVFLLEYLAGIALEVITIQEFVKFLGVLEEEYDREIQL